MKLLAAINNTQAVFSVSHYDCRCAEGLLADGGQPGLQNYAGYTRSSSVMVWIELPGVTFADLQNDYLNENSGKRKYGVHPLSEVKILAPQDYPDTESFEWQKENYVWGTNGKSGRQKMRYILLKDAEDSHLQAILDNCPHIKNTLTEKVIRAIQKDRAQKA